MIAKNKPQTDLKIVDNQHLSCYDDAMKKVILPIAALLLLATILLMIWWNRTEIGALAPRIVLTPEDAAVRHVRGTETVNFTVASNSMEAVQSVALQDQVLVLVQYSGTRPEGGVDICETVLETKKTRLNGWKVTNGAGLCHEVNPARSIPVTSGSSRGHPTPQDPGYSTSYGQVCDPQPKSWSRGKTGIFSPWKYRRARTSPYAKADFP